MEETTDMSEVELEVEKIVDVKEVYGKRNFLLKWRGFPNSQNTWEPEENLMCPEMVDKFYEARAKATKKNTTLLLEVDENDQSPSGFDRGLQPDKILGATPIGEELYFLMKWIGAGHKDLVSARQANAKCPQTVIAFYEERLVWALDEDEIVR